MHRAQQAAAGPPQHVLGGEVLGALCEFLEAAVHVVLHAREVYPKEAFERCRIYATQVHRCRHPKVSEYVGAVVHQLKVRCGGQAAALGAAAAAHWQVGALAVAAER